MITQYNLVTDVPSVLAIDCLGNWLSLEDVCLLDSACCCRKEREVLLALFDSDEFIVTQVTNIDNVDMTKWLCKRSIRVSSIHIQTAGDGAEVSKYLGLFGIHVRIVHFIPETRSAFSKIILGAVRDNCRRLTALTCLLCSTLSSTVVDTILLRNPELVLLELIEVNLDGKVLQEVYLPKLKQLQLTNTYLSNALCEALSVSVASQIERLDLSFTDFEKTVPEMFWSSFRNLCALQVGDCQFMNDQQLQSIALNCPFVIHLCLDCCYRITDVGILYIGMHLTQLRSLDIRYCRTLSDLSIQYLTQYRASQLQTLFFDVWHFTSAVISDLLKHCQSLVEVGINLLSSQGGPIVNILTDSEWEEIVTAAPAIRKWVFEVGDSLNLPFKALAQNCQQVRELHISGSIRIQSTFSDRENVLSLLACCPQLRVLRVSSDMHDKLVAGGILDMYPHLQVVMVDMYPPFNTLDRPI